MSKVFDIIKKEQNRQNNVIELIASENFPSENVRLAVGSIMMNKYTEGYPEKRYYGGCENFDVLENYCKEQWQKVFHTNYHVNVQPHSGSNANLAAYMAVLKPGDTVLSMSLENGGHLTHGSPVNISGKLFNFIHYNVNEQGYIDYDDLAEKILEYKPSLIVAGASAYSREIDFHKIYDIVHSIASLSTQCDYNKYVYDCGEDRERPKLYTPYLMVDMSHIAGLVAAGEHQSPFGLADIITTTTHKTLRGNRGALIFCKNELAKKIDSAVFPCTQGGSLMNEIAGKAVTAEEAQTEKYKEYIHQVVANAKAMAEEFQKLGFNVVSGGTDNHMFLIDLRTKYPTISGREAQQALDAAGITVNKNCVPNESCSPMETSGIRIGTSAMTTKGWKEEDFILCAHRIYSCLENLNRSRFIFFKNS